MDFSTMIAKIFGIIFIIILYVIIYYALKIMYKDVKGGGQRRRPRRSSANFGLEILTAGSSSELKRGSIIPIRSDLSIGRKVDNSIVLSDQHVSGNHARISVKSNGLFLQDLDSTNGTFLNGRKVVGRSKLSNKDEIKIGTAVFKILM